MRNNKDLVMAKNLLYNEKLTICIVKNQQIVLKSTRRGIYPMYIAITEHFNDLVNASIADRVIGRAAAMLNAYAKTKHVYSEIVSEGAKEILNKNKINLSYINLVPYIQNRAKDNLCPIEKISSSLDENDYLTLVEKIREFLLSIKVL